MLLLYLLYLTLLPCPSRSPSRLLPPAPPPVATSIFSSIQTYICIAFLSMFLMLNVYAQPNRLLPPPWPGRLLRYVETLGLTVPLLTLFLGQSFVVFEGEAWSSLHLFIAVIILIINALFFLGCIALMIFLRCVDEKGAQKLRHSVRKFWGKLQKTRGKRRSSKKAASRTAIADRPTESLAEEQKSTTTTTLGGIAEEAEEDETKSEATPATSSPRGLKSAGERLAWLTGPGVPERRPSVDPLQFASADLAGTSTMENNPSFEPTQERGTRTAEDDSSVVSSGADTSTCSVGPGANEQLRASLGLSPEASFVHNPASTTALTLSLQRRSDPGEARV